MTNGCFVIAFTQRRYLALAELTPEPVSVSLPNGWRPIVWTADLARAEKFASREAAELFLRAVPVLDAERNNERTGCCQGAVRWVPAAATGGEYGDAE